MSLNVPRPTGFRNSVEHAESSENPHNGIPNSVPGEARSVSSQIYWILYWIVAATFHHLFQSCDWYVGVRLGGWWRLVIAWGGFVSVAVLSDQGDKE